MATSAAAISTISIKPGDQVVVLSSDGVQFRGVVDFLAQNDIDDRLLSVTLKVRDARYLKPTGSKLTDRLDPRLIRAKASLGFSRSA